MTALLMYLIVINAAGFVLMLTDKLRAVRKEWRIPEAVLILCALIGGSIGVLLGIHLSHHKTRHALFFVGVPVILSLQIIFTVAFILFFP